MLIVPIRIAAEERNSTLQKATLNSVPLQECNRTYYTRFHRDIRENQICAVNSVNDDVCQRGGDGPLQIQSSTINLYKVVGITSYGVGCGTKYPVVYTTISSYLDWIEEIVWPGPI